MNLIALSDKTRSKKNEKYYTSNEKYVKELVAKGYKFALVRVQAFSKSDDCEIISKHKSYKSAEKAGKNTNNSICDLEYIAKVFDSVKNAKRGE